MPNGPPSSETWLVRRLAAMLEIDYFTVRAFAGRPTG